MVCSKQLSGSNRMEERLIDHLCMNCRNLNIDRISLNLLMIRMVDLSQQDLIRLKG